MKIVIDLGTSRTAIGILRNDNDWEEITPPRYGGVQFGFRFDSLRRLIDRVQHIESKSGKVPHIIANSRYCTIGNLALPIYGEEETFESFPPLCGIVPPPRGKTSGFSVKENKEWAAAFLGALVKMVSSWIGNQTTNWVIGRSCKGSIDPRTFLKGSQSFNEAVAVIFALATLEPSRFSQDGKKNFVLLADLGGGFLDISLAHEVYPGEREGTAEVANYGGYPLGVDRIGNRFSFSPINNVDSLRAPILATILYHMWAYQKEHSSPHSEGVVFLTGGGFQRLDPSISAWLRQQIPQQAKKALNLQVEVPAHGIQQDTKLLTIVGLSRLSSLDDRKILDADMPDCSGRSPFHYGKHIWDAARIEPSPGSLTWSDAMGAYIRETYGSNQ